MSLPRNKFQFNGATDANGVVSQQVHNTHDVGMAFDLGVGDYIDRAVAQVDPKDAGNAGMKDFISKLDKVGWSVENAVLYSGLLVNETGPTKNNPTKKLDNQVSALRDFLSLFALTRSDQITGNGTWDDLPVKNGEAVRAALFGTGQAAGGLISAVHIGGVVEKTQNPYPSINAILDKLGINHSPVDAHQTHFHIYLRPPALVEIGGAAHLLADNPLAMPPDSASATSAATLQTEAKGLLDYTQTLITGEELMFTMDVPSVPAQETPIVLAQAATPSTTPQPDYILKTCKETTSTIVGDPTSADRVVDPAGMLYIYFQRIGRDIDLASIKNITLLEDAKHGKISSGTSNYGRTFFGYDPVPEYVGDDRAVFMAEFEGKHYKIVVNLKVVIVVDDNSPQCPAKPVFIKVNKKPSTGSSGYDLNSVTVTFTNLTGGAVGQDVGSTITLDTTAAGNGWFIDATPADNSEFLATSNPNEWVAKAGSAAAGKMDMLSVLLHEYGHALGIDHSTDPNDFMGTTLTVGVRRLPSAAELALMQQLIAQAKNGLGSVGAASAANNPSATTWPFAAEAAPTSPDNTPFPGLPISLGGLAFAGLLRPNRYGSTSIDAVSAPQYDVAANASFNNLDTAGAWQTQGSVDIAPSTGSGQGGIATLNEVSTSQTRLSQVFMLGANDRYLSFTLAGSALDNPSGAPQDAFEVALLNANTGASVLGTDGMMEQLAIRLGGQTTPTKSLVMTRSDAFLNLQADGTQNAASCVTCINNADGSRTYRVDLTGVAKNSAVNLSFDLLGFGVANSHVTLRDIRTSGLPQLRDDVASIAEDNTLGFDPYAQADAALRPMLASSVVNAPTHGAITVNADGSVNSTFASADSGLPTFGAFSYTPDLNYFGADITSDLAGVVGQPSQMASSFTSSSISFSYRLSDPSTDSGQAQDRLRTGSGQALDSNLATVSPVNDAPTSNTVTTLEDTPYVFKVADFGFGDAQDIGAQASRLRSSTNNGI